jgi:uncharacterized protein DUF6932
MTERLQQVIALAQGTGKLERVFIGGSYVTDKPDPRDIDLFLIMSSDFESNDSQVLCTWCLIAKPLNASWEQLSSG